MQHWDKGESRENYAHPTVTINEEDKRPELLMPASRDEVVMG